MVERERDALASKMKKHVGERPRYFQLTDTDLYRDFPEAGDAYENVVAGVDDLLAARF
jgi:hypothetical protein